MKYRLMIVILMMILLNVFWPIALGQEDQVTNPDETWHIITRFTTIFIGEDILINVTGPDNTTFSLRFISADDSNDTFERYYRTDEEGKWFRLFPSFREEQEGNYTIQLIVDGLLKESRQIEVIYNEDQAQWIAIDDGVENDDRQDRDYVRIDNRMDILENRYKKWIMYFFIPVTCAFVFCGGISLLVMWPVIRVWFNKDKKDISDSKRAKWTIEFLTGGSPSEDFDDEFPGSIKDDGEAVFEKDDPRVTPDTYGLTEDEVEKARREAHYGKDWKKEVPFGSVPDDEYKYPEPFNMNIILTLILLTSSIITLILSIWLIWFVTIPSGITLLILTLIFYYMKFKKETFSFEEEDQS